MRVLREGSGGGDVTAMQERLRTLGFNPGAIDGEFGPATLAAVLAFQKSESLLPDGVVGPRTAAVLSGGGEVQPLSVIPSVTTALVSRMFPFTPLDNIKAGLPVVLDQLADLGLTDKKMVLMALATIRAEAEDFAPKDERPSRFNTSPGGHLFDLYDNRRDLGNQGSPDGQKYRGRGFIQLTGRVNYQLRGPQLDLNDRLVNEPDLANNFGVAARLLASFLKGKEMPIKEALLEGDLRTARRLVNGGTNGLDRFVDAYHSGDRLIPDPLCS